MELLDTGEKFDLLLLLDFAMPGMNGPELARRVRAKRPALPVLFVTGYAEHNALIDISERHIISKPFVTNELADKVRLALSG